MSDTAFTSNFVSDQDVVVEQTIVSEGSTGILGSVGYAPSNGESPGTRIWDFAEGSTRNPYQTYFVLFNPGDHGPAFDSVSASKAAVANVRSAAPPFGRWRSTLARSCR